MATNLKNITVNGVPLKIYVDEEAKQEIRSQHSVEVGSLNRGIKPHIITSSVRNHSGARSSHGRVIYSAGGHQ